MKLSSLHTAIRLLVCVLVMSVWIGIQQTAAALQLSDFVMKKQIDRLELPAPDEAGDFSGATFVDYGGGKQRIFIVDNKTTNIYEYDLDGRHQRTIGTKGFDDTEGIAYLGDDRFAVVEERRAEISIFTIDADTTSIDKTKDAQVIKPVLADGSSLNPDGGNTGLEGIAYDRKENRLYIVKEKDSRRVFSMALSTEPGKSELLADATDALKTKFDDFADVYFDNASRDLFVLSQESNRIARIGTEGTLRESLDIPGKQPEGLAISPDGRQMVIVGEQREFIYFVAEPKGPAAPSETPEKTVAEQPAVMTPPAATPPAESPPAETTPAETTPAETTAADEASFLDEAEPETGPSAATAAAAAPAEESPAEPSSKGYLWAVVAVLVLVGMAALGVLAYVFATKSKG